MVFNTTLFSRERIRFFILTTTLFVVAATVCRVDAVVIDDRTQMTLAWQRIMDDLESIVRQNADSGPGIDGSFVDYGIEPNGFIVEARQTAPKSLQAELDLLETNLSYKSARGFYAEDYALNISFKEFDKRMWIQFQKSFNRELRTLSKTAAGLLMAKFATSWALRPPVFMSPLVFYSWAGDDDMGLKIHKLAQLTIWNTGNPAAIEEFVPSLLTNRMGGFALRDLSLKFTGQTSEAHPSSDLKGWEKKYPAITAHALEKAEMALTSGDLKRSTLFQGEAETAWTTLPNSEILRAFDHMRAEKCTSSLAGSDKAVK